MKIGELTRGEAIGKDLDVPKTRKSVKSEEFQNLLVEELGAKMESGANCGRVSEFAGPGNMPVALYPGLNTFRAGEELSGSRGASGAVHTLSRGLGEIHGAISEGKTSPRELEKMLTKLTREAEDFENSVGGLSSDHPLRQVSEQLNVLAYVESVKWKRGDYL